MYVRLLAKKIESLQKRLSTLIHLNLLNIIDLHLSLCLGVLIYKEKWVPVDTHFKKWASHVEQPLRKSRHQNIL